MHATADGEIVVLHDPSLERTTDGSGPVSALPLGAGRRARRRLPLHARRAHLSRIRGQGVRIPALREVLREFPAHRFNIEIKQGGAAVVDAVLDVLRGAASLERVLLAAEHDDIMQTIRDAVGDRVATSMSVGEVIDFVGRLQRGDWDGYAPPGRRCRSLPPTAASSW